MNKRIKIVSVALLFAAFIWIMDALWDYYVFYKGESLIDLMFFNMPPHEIYIRTVITICFLVFGLFMGEALTRQQKTKVELGETEKRFKLMFENSPLAYQSLDKDGNFLEVNPAWCDTLGYARKEVIGKNFADFLAPGYREHFKKNFPRFKEAGEISGVQFEMLTKDGSALYVEYDGRIGLDEFGHFKQTHCIFKDISERKKSEREIQDREHKLETLSDSSREINKDLDVTSIMRTLVAFGMELTGAASGTSGLMIDEKLMFSEYNDKGKLINIDYSFRKGYGVPGWIIETKKPYITNDAENDPHVVPEIQKKLGFYNLIDVPIISADGQLLGCFELHNTKDKRAFDQRDAYLLEGLAANAAVALENAFSFIRRQENLEKITSLAKEWQTTFDAIGDAVCLVDISRKILKCNKATEKFLDRPEAKIVGHTCCQLIHGTPSPIEGCPVSTALTTLKREEVELKLGDKWINIVADPVFDKEGQMIGAVHIMSDITSRKKAEEEVVNLAKFPSENPSPVLRINREKEIIYANDSAKALLKDLNMEGSVSGDLSHVVDIAFDTGKGVLQEIDLGSKVFSFNAAPIAEADYVNLYGRDVTKRKKTERELDKYRGHLEDLVEERTKELESFSYSVSHDLRAPLRSIDGFSQAILEDYIEKLDDKGKDYLNRIRNGSQHMGQLIDDLLKLSRVTRIDAKEEVANLSQIAEGIAQELREADKERKAEFSIQKGVIARGDKNLMYIALENLMDNAWKFTSKNPKAKIEFGIKSVNGENTYFIHDNGVGFKMEYADKLFGEFQRMHTSKEFPGTGIGLATVKRVISKHGGKIWAESEEGKGATFYFTLQE